MQRTNLTRGTLCSAFSSWAVHAGVLAIGLPLWLIATYAYLYIPQGQAKVSAAQAQILFSTTPLW